MNPYIIEVSTSENPRNLIFWSIVGFLKQQSSGKIFARLTLKSKDAITPEQDWEFYTNNIGSTVNLKVKREQPINKVTDELGNIYYEVTDLFK